MERKGFVEKKIASLLSEEPFFSQVFYYDILPSTNDFAKEMASSGASEGTIVLAGSQTAGKGRMGRSFFSPEGDGLYLSIILKPDTGFDPGLITACAAVAVRQAVEELMNLSVSIKWVNDLYIGNKKLCGILAEGHFSKDGLPDYIILGIGLNLKTPTGGYPEDLASIVTALSDVMPEEDIPDVSLLCVAIVKQFSRLYKKLPDVGFLETYRSASCVLGKRISYVLCGEKKVGTALLIDDSASLVVQNDNGETETLSTGEVSFVRPIM